MKHTQPFFKLFYLFCFILLTISHSSAQTNAAQLKVIPEVKEFVVRNGNITLSGKIRIIVDHANADSLMPVALQLKDELQLMQGIKASVKVSRNPKIKKGEILLQTKCNQNTNSEAYTILLDEGISISGASKTGTFWGTRTILQLIENYQNKIPRGTINDFPDYPKRGFMLDTGRKFFTIDFLRHYVKFMSYYKMNEFQIHLNDNGFKKYFDNDFKKTYAAFRLESDSFPGLTAKDGHYTKKEFRDLQLLGMQYGVNVIPEIDVPAHALAFTQYRPELAMNENYMDHLSIAPKDTAAVFSFIDKLFSEYTTGKHPVFVGPDFHIGTDEYDRRYAIDFYHFTDRYIKFVEKKGYRCRLWGGMRWMQPALDAKEFTARIKNNNGAIINAWSHDWVDSNQQIRDGFKIINTCDEWLYIVPKAGYYRDTLDIQDLYLNFRPEQVNSRETILPELRYGLIGAMFAVWNDIVGNGITQHDVHDRALPAMKVVSTKLWKVNPEKPYTDYRTLSNSLSEGPGLKLTEQIPPDQK